MSGPDRGMFIEYLVIGAYLVLLMVIGLVVRRFNKDHSDYFRSGCQGTWWLVGASAFMVAFSAWTFTGAAGVAYESGWSVMVIYLANAAGFLLNAVLLAPWFRQLRVITVPQAIRDRFDGRTQQFYAWISVITGLLYASMWLYGLAIFSSAVFGFDIQVVIIVIGIVVLVYSTAGGSWAVLAADFMQTLILVPITILIAWLCLREMGGVSGMFDLIHTRGLEQDYSLVNASGRHAHEQFTWLWAVAMFLKNVIGYNTLTSANRYFAVKTGREARYAATLGLVLMVLGSFIWFIPPIAARLLFQADVDALAIAKPQEASYAVVSMKLLPTGMTGMMVVAMFAATMSSMDSGLNRNAAVIVEDIYPTFCRLLGIEPMGPRGRMRLGQVTSLGCGITIIAMTLYFASHSTKGVFDLMLDIGAMLALPMAVPMLLAMFIKRTPSWAAMASVSAALGVSAIGFYSESLFGIEWTFQSKVFASIGVGSAVYFATLPFWPTADATYRAKVDTFFECMHRPVDFAEEVGETTDLRQLKVIGTFAVTIGVFISSLVFLPNPWDGRVSILCVGGFVLGVGLLLIVVGRRSTVSLTEPEPVSLEVEPCESTCL